MNTQKGGKFPGTVRPENVRVDRNPVTHRMETLLSLMIPYPSRNLQLLLNIIGLLIFVKLSATERGFPDGKFRS